MNWKNASNKSSPPHPKWKTTPGSKRFVMSFAAKLADLTLIVAVVHAGVGVMILHDGSFKPLGAGLGIQPTPAEYLIRIHAACARHTCDRGPWLQRFFDDSATLRL